MSLTTVLSNSESRVSQYLDDIMDPKAAQSLVNKCNEQLARKFRVSNLAPENHQWALVGTAFDYAFRWVVEVEFDADTLVAMHGAKMCDANLRGGNIYSAHDLAINGMRAKPIRRTEHQDMVRHFVSVGNSKPHTIAAASIVLSWYEQAYRSGAYDPIIKALETGDLGPGLYRNIPEYEKKDVQVLIDTIDDVWNVFSIREDFVQNPVLPNSRYVGGADGDWIANGVLYDCKTSMKRKPMTMMHLKQVITYALLDWDNTLELSGLGWYYSRQKAIIEFPIAKLISDLPAKRQGLKAILKQQYLYRIDALTKIRNNPNVMTDMPQAVQWAIQNKEFFDVYQMLDMIPNNEWITLENWI